MLAIKNQEHFARVLAFAAKKGPQHMDWLTERLWQLHLFFDTAHDNNREMPVDTTWPAEGIPLSWRGRVVGGVRVELHYDGAAASFYWLAYPNTDEQPARLMMNGGLIYHGDQTGWREDGQYTDPFSVELTRGPNDNPWSIHT